MVFLAELNLSHNRMSKLPEELRNLTQLVQLNISHNAFLNLPKIAYELPKLEQVNAEKNHIADVDVDRLRRRGNLRLVNLKENPLSKKTEEDITSKPSPACQLTIQFTPQVLDEDGF